MSAASLDPAAPIAGRPRHLLPWLLVVASVALLFVPTLIDLWRQIWSQDPNNQGPIAVAMAAWLWWKRGREPATRELLARPEGDWRVGLAWLIPGLIAYALGRSQSLLLVEMMAIVPALVGITITLFGTRLSRHLWFCFAFLVFTIPIPGVLVDWITQPFKIGVSWASEQVLYALAYPVARDGVILHLGPYQLLVADACAGMHSLFTLEALGLLYLNLVRHESPLRNAAMAILIVPISFAANTLRVVTLALITYHVSDAAGRGFVHDFAGVVLFVLALILILAADLALRRIGRMSRS